MKKLCSFSILSLSLTLNACMIHDIPELLPSPSSLPQLLTGIPYAKGIPLSAGESTTIHFFTNEANLHSDVGLESGRDYALSVQLLSNWNDAAISENENGEMLDETGFADSVMPYGWVNRFKRSGEHRWFELMLYQRDCRRDSLSGVTELEYDEQSNSYQFTASCNGALSVFVNDTRGFYGNNVGYANLSVSKLN